MKRSELIENLIQSRNSESSWGKSIYLFYSILFFIILFVIGSTYFNLYKLSINDIVSCLAGSMLFIFLGQYNNHQAKIKYLYCFIALCLYICWALILTPGVYTEIVESGFPKGWECLAEILLIGIAFGITFRKLMVKRGTNPPLNIGWIAFMVAIGAGFMLVNLICQSSSNSHDFIWHGIGPVFLVFWIFFRKL